ncbi:hypothetical protein CspeluHIS016_0602760 [Cutaneotrichosporon spelunceum]|uniref:Uncharacterized protein n=1 Tax=Cutaneotrichosporon spelunceum TaxID=1672016 RepID=A0AAD3TYG1_9TREE|nr:hypothetical protein CspeluHIS016_0602760 [Cutaneotrichosporon spelunceum]
MSYYYPTIIQLVVFALVAVLSIIQGILAVVALVIGYWPSIGALIHGLIVLTYCLIIFTAHRRSTVKLLQTKWDIVFSLVLAISGIIVGIFCGMVAIGTFVLLLGWFIFECVFVGTRKISGKWNMTLYDLAEVDMTGSSMNAAPPVTQQYHYA